MNIWFRHNVAVELYLKFLIFRLSSTIWKFLDFLLSIVQNVWNKMKFLNQTPFFTCFNKLNSSCYSLFRLILTYEILLEKKYSQRKKDSSTHNVRLGWGSSSFSAIFLLNTIETSSLLVNNYFLRSIANEALSKVLLPNSKPVLH